MKILLLVSILFSSLFAVVHRVPHDRETIQEGINAAEPGDTVLVDEGIYYENLQIDKEITVGSYYILDGNLSHRDSTIIDGSSADENSPYGSCVLFLPSDNGDPISAKLTGFTIQNGQGTRVNDSSQGETMIYRMGGGIMIDHCLPEITYNYIRNNGGETADRGPGTGRGGGGMFNNDDDVEFDEDRSGSYLRTQLTRDDNLKFSNNIFENNYSQTGNTFEANSFEGDIDFSGSFFDVFASDYEDVSEYWIVADQSNNNFSEGSGELEAITGDVWVSPGGMDSKITEGTESDPFQTIDYAFSRIYAAPWDPVTINLADGTFSPTTTGQEFPIMMISNVNLIGQGEDNTILDAESTARVILINNCDNNILSHLTMTGGNGTGGGLYTQWSGGGAINITSSNPTLSHLTIDGNSWMSGTHGHGGGIYLYSSFPNMTYLTVTNNIGNVGGGIYYFKSGGYLSHSTVSNNSANITYAGNAGGILLAESDPVLTNVVVSMNEAEWDAGGMKIGSMSNPALINVTVVENTAQQTGGGILNQGSPIVRNVTIANNSSGDSEEVAHFGFSAINTIIWNNSLDPTWVNISGSYNYIAGNSENENEYPFSSGDYTLSDGSPCIDSGSPDLWYQDQDGTPSDIGSTGGLFVMPNFTSYDFGEVGPIGATADFELYNFRETTITIESVNFESSSFHSSTVFPISIEPQQTGIIEIVVNNSNFSVVEDHMTLTSNDLPDGINIPLSVQGTEQNLLSGNLSGTLHSAVYNISGNINVASSDELVIEPGTEFLFDGNYDFTVEGTLKAQGTVEDSIIFRKSGNGTWRGFTLSGVTDETIFDYVLIRDGNKGYAGGGMYLINSDPTIMHVDIKYNYGGMRLQGSNPTMSYVDISYNSGSEGAGMNLELSDPIMSHVLISNNSCTHGAGMGIYNQSAPVMNNVTIVNNSASGTGGAIYAYSGQPTLINCTVSGNTAQNWANGPNGGIVNDGGSNIEIINSIVWGNAPVVSINATVTYSNIQSGSEGLGNIDTDPLFSDSGNGDFTLQDGSPCIDAGIEIDGMEYVGSAPDMGAYEFGANYGCTDPEAINFDSDANLNDGSCEYSADLSDLGCMDESACNYDPQATEDDGSCTYEVGEMDCDGVFHAQTKEALQTAVDMWVDDNATALATYGEINTWDVSLITDMSFIFSEKTSFNNDISGWNTSSATTMQGMFYNALSFNQNLSSWNTSNVTNMQEMFRNPHGGDSDFNGDITTWDVSSVTNMAQMFRAADDFNQDISGWDVSNVANMWGMFFDAAIFNQDISGWDVSGCNLGGIFDGVNGLSDENKCAIDASFSGNGSWPYDWSGLCSVAGCTDETACNFNADATEDDGSCAYPEFGGVTPDSLAFEFYPNESEEETQSLTLTNSGECPLEVTIAIGSDTGDSVTDYDGNVYQTVEIGERVWMKENLKVTHYNDGSDIPTGYSNSEWADLDETETGAYAVYDDNPANADTYGYIYNWYAVEDDRGVCPEGWNVPTDDEIKELEMYLGMSQSEADDTGFRGTNEGSQLAGNADLWNDGNLENNSEFGTSGFDFLPGGYRFDSTGDDYDMGSYGYLWSSTEKEGSSSNAWFRALNYSSSEVYRAARNKRSGYSVRCIRDRDEWLSVSAEVITIPPGESASVDVTASVSGIDHGDYTSAITISTNDTDNSLMEVPITLSVHPPVPGCTDETACNYNADATEDDGSCEYAEEYYDCDEICLNDIDEDLVCDELEIPGCDDDVACNYDSSATDDDGSCEYAEEYYDCEGNPVDGEATILSIVDIPNDQGGWVYIQFERSGHDTDSLRTNESYTVERLDGENWVSLTSITAYGADTYTTEARTLVDSTASDAGLTTFRIIAGMDEGNWASEPADGYSVDNIAPSIPTGLLTNVSGGNVDLTWDVSADEDFNYFSIYRSENENFTPSDDNLLGNSVEGSFTDTPPPGVEVVFYRVSAVDIHDNEGEASAIASAVLMSSMSIGYFTAWNMVGLPLSVEDSGYQALFPNAQSGSLYSFDGIYQEQESLEPGVGYLLRMNIEDNVSFTGFLIDELIVDLSSGWNLFSGLSSSISSDAVYSNDIVQSGTIYGLDGLYYNAETIDPGKGYWVRATEDGEITISSGVSAKQVSFVSKVDQANSIAFSNGNYTTELYFGVEIPVEEILSYSLPPTFPQMAFDVRFSGDMKYAVESGEIEVLNQSERLTIEYDITIDAGEKMEWVLSSKTGDKFVLEGTGEITVPSEQRFVLTRLPVIPETFTLHQNYPNPFNPITTLRYDLPSDALVTLNVYDMLGQEITQLVNTNQQAGFKSVQWDATDSMGRPVSAGVYLYQIEAGKFLQTKKMVLLK